MVNLFERLPGHTSVMLMGLRVGIPIRDSVAVGAYHLNKISEKSGWNVNGKVVFWKFRPGNFDLPSEVFFFSSWNEPIENYLTI